MKINEKHLAKVAGSYEDSSENVLSGWLNKQNESTANFQKRWCVLKRNLFFYFEKKNDKEPLGVIVLENCFVQLAEEDDLAYTFSIHFTGDGSKVYKFAASDDDNCTVWVKALSISSYRYLSILVKGLEKDVESLQLQKSSSSPQIHVSNSCGDLVTLDEKEQNRDRISSSFRDTKSSSYNNILEAVEEIDHSGTSKNDSLKVSILRARSSSDLDIYSKSNQFYPASMSVVKLKAGKTKQKRSMIKKLSPKLSKSSSKTLKHKQSASHNPVPEDLIIRARAEAVVTLDDDFLVFTKMHENFRDAIARFIAS